MNAFNENFPGASVILFDGVCNLCNGFVQFIIRHDKRARFKFASLQSEAAHRMLKPIGFPPEELKTIVLIENWKMFLRSRAVLRIAKQLDGFWKLSAVLYILPSFLSDFVYNLISRYRYRIFGERESCMVPTPELRSRFIE